MIYFCCDKLRRQEVSTHPTLRGIDFLEVSADQTQLFIHFVPASGVKKETVPKNVKAANIQISGGERITKIYIDNVAYQKDVLVVTVDDGGESEKGVGDFSTYTLRLTGIRNLDPVLSAVDFSFKVGCPSDFDCQPRCVCPPAQRDEPEINYLAKDYASFRQLMLDRMSALMPQWKERHAADLGMTLVELLAYVGDYLSYQQDAVATEAYLGTARRRVSVRRHARLVDYFMHDGCNARAWVQVQVNADSVSPLPKGTQLFTNLPGQPVVLPNDSQVLKQAYQQVVFETMEEIFLFQKHTEIQFYAWGDERCCLPKGAARATLQGNLPNLKAGDILIFEEALGPKTGQPEDADPTRRCAVRLTNVWSQEAKGKPLTDPLMTGDAALITEIQWGTEDALPFPFCLSSVTDDEHGKKAFKGVSVARGNIVLADHGQGVKGESLCNVPLSSFKTPSTCDRCNPPEPQPGPLRYHPALAKVPLTFAAPYENKSIFSITPTSNQLTADISDLDKKTLPTDLSQQFETAGISFVGTPSIQGVEPFWSISDGTQSYLIKNEDRDLNVYKLPVPAQTAMQFAPANALPAISLHSKLGKDEADWSPQSDLLDSGPDAPDFVVEIENDGTAFLRFGDDNLGARPEPLTMFTTNYRVGNGAAGNVGAEAITHLFTEDQPLAQELRAAVVAVRNPLPAKGGADPESIEDVRQRAPAAFRTQERAVTEADYAEVTERHSEVQKAVATFRWTGSWHTVFIAIDRIGGLEVDKDFQKTIRDYVEQYRMAGYDLEVDGPQFVSLEIGMCVCAKPDYFRSNIEETLLALFSNHVLPDGRLGVFHPDNFTFNQPVWLSRLIAAAQNVEGVASVHVKTFQRQGTPDPTPLAEGKLEIGRLEIARCDNDPNFPEHGVFRLTVGGGK